MSPDFCTLPSNLCVWLCFSTAVLLLLSSSQYMPFYGFPTLSPPSPASPTLALMVLPGSQSTLMVVFGSVTHSFFPPCSVRSSYFNRWWDIYLKGEIAIHHQPFQTSVSLCTPVHLCPFFLFWFSLVLFSPRPLSFYISILIFCLPLFYVLQKTSVPFLHTSPATWLQTSPVLCLICFSYSTLTLSFLQFLSIISNKVKKTFYIQTKIQQRTIPPFIYPTLPFLHLR